LTGNGKGGERGGGEFFQKRHPIWENKELEGGKRKSGLGKRGQREKKGSCGLLRRD